MKFYQKAKKVLLFLGNPALAYIYTLLRGYTMIPVGLYIANLKLARSAAAIPGAIVECGTWKGGMIAGIARLLGENREYYLFDSFEGLPKVEAIDGSAARSWQANTESPGYYDNCRASTEDALAAMSIAKISEPHLIKGWFEETLPLASIPGGIAILRMDADWYKSTYQILDSLFPQVITGGLILIDDYYTWDGCSKAVHDYLSEHKRPERISSFEGVCFIRKITAEQGSGGNA
jgi:O-methyltransferase